LRRGIEPGLSFLSSSSFFNFGIPDYHIDVVEGSFPSLSLAPGIATYSQIMDGIGVLRKKYSNPKTIHRILAAIKKYYDYPQHIGIREDHPCRSIKLRDGKRRDIQLQDLFSTKELELLLESKPKRERNRRLMR